MTPLLKSKSTKSTLMGSVSFGDFIEQEKKRAVREQVGEYFESKKVLEELLVTKRKFEIKNDH